MSDPGAARPGGTWNTAQRLERVDAIESSFEPRPWRFAEEEAAAIDAHWAELTARNPRLFNGRVLLQHRHAIVERGEGNRIFRGAWLETDFKAFIGWRDFGFPDADVRNCFAMGALTGSAGGFVLGEMAAHTANAGRIYFPAGTPDPSDLVGDRVDIEGSVMRELLEETGLGADDVIVEPGWTLVFDGPRIACMKSVRGLATAPDLAARIEAALALDPHAELAAVHIVRGIDDLDAARMPPYLLAYLSAELGGSPVQE